jgi:hypothetical protein
MLGLHPHKELTKEIDDFPRHSGSTRRAGNGMSTFQKLLDQE